MTSVASRAATLLRRAPSRTRTARTPLGAVAASAIAGFPFNDFDGLYAGPVDRLPFSPLFPDHTVSLPFADVALQVEATTSNPDALVLLMVDLGVNRDLARIELYGNLLLQPDFQGGRPVHNFGLPTSIGVAVRERPFTYADLHGRLQRGTFFADLSTDWGIRYASQDLRGLWGWTPLALPATYGRFLMFVFGGLPPLPAKRHGVAGFGLDIQRLVLFPYQVGVDHRPSVEYGVASARQSRYLGPTDYWTAAGVANPDPVDDQAVTFEAGYDALCLPSALIGLDAVSPVQGPIGVYASAPISTDLTTNDALALVLQSTSDEIPLISAVRLEFPTDRGKIVGAQGLPALPDYLVSASVTNDREAAWSADRAHPGWRPVAEERLVESSRIPEAMVEFAEPAWARWVRLLVRPVAPTGSGLAAAPVVLRRLDLVRPRHWTLSPEPDEDIALESVSIRLRGHRLTDDYASLNGQASAGIAVEIRQDAGSYQLVRGFRSLLELIEETHNRMFVNHRAFDRPLQRYRETSTATTRTKSTSDQSSSGRSTTVVRPEFGNLAATRTGSVTTYTDDPRRNLDQQPHFTSLPASVDDGLTTTRTFEVDLDSLTLPEIDPTTMGVDQIVASVIAWAQELSNQGAPVSLGIGSNVGFNLGAAAGIQVGGSTGVSLNAGSQLGGGVTRSTVVGSQANVTVAETFTTDALTTQDQHGTSRVQATGELATTDTREVERRDHSPQERVVGTEVQFAGRQEDIVIVSVPINATLRGSPLVLPGDPTRPLRARDAVRVRLDHLPDGIEMDVEFRGQLVPRPRGG